MNDVIGVASKKLNSMSLGGGGKFQTKFLFCLFELL